MTSLSAKDKFLGEERRVGFKPTALWFKTNRCFFYKKATYIMQFYTESAYFSAYYCVFLQFNLQFISF